jgi:hypothetical protein
VLHVGAEVGGGGGRRWSTGDSCVGAGAGEQHEGGCGGGGGRGGHGGGADWERVVMRALVRRDEDRHVVLASLYLHPHDKSIKSMHRYGLHLIDRSSSQSEATGATINV